MSLEIDVQNSLKKAMLEKNQAALRTLRAIKSGILLVKTEKGFDGNFTEDQELKLLQKMVKQRKDALTIFQDQAREDLAATELEEIEILETFLPKQLSDVEVENILKALVTETGANSMKDMGKLVGLANQKVAGQAEGQTIARLLKKLLQ